jgi:capsular exopolysaccharide synthesis family protein
MLKTIIQNFHLEKLFWIIKTKLKYMILIGLVFGVLAGGFAYLTKTDTYMAQISMYVYTNPDYINDNGINISASDINSANALLSSYMQIMKSDSFLKSVIEDAELDTRMYTVSYLRRQISSSAVSNTAVFKVFVYDPNPYNAMLIANTIGKLAPQKIISIVKSGGIEVLDEAVLPTAPYQSTSVGMMAFIGLFAGGFLSGILFLIRGLMDTRYRRVYEVEDMFNIPILGMVPQMDEKDEDGNTQVILSPESPFVLKEAYNDIRANLLFLGAGQKCPVFAVTGADYDEGKTTNSVNVAKSFAMMGKKTLLVDADLRNGDVAQVMGISSDKGLSEYLAGLSELKKCKNVMDNLDVITTGAYPPNPTDLLIGERWKKLISDMKEEYEIIIIDTPSIGVVADGVEVVNVATAFVVVIREFVTKFEREELIIRRLDAVNANICGFIYNGINVKSVDYNHKEYVNGGDYGKRSVARV